MGDARRELIKEIADGDDNSYFLWTHRGNLGLNFTREELQVDANAEKFIPKDPDAVNYTNIPADDIEITSGTQPELIKFENVPLAPIKPFVPELRFILFNKDSPSLLIYRHTEIFTGKVKEEKKSIPTRMVSEDLLPKIVHVYVECDIECFLEIPGADRDTFNTDENISDGKQVRYLPISLVPEYNVGYLIDVNRTKKFISKSDLLNKSDCLLDDDDYNLYTVNFDDVCLFAPTQHVEWENQIIWDDYPTQNYKEEDEDDFEANRGIFKYLVPAFVEIPPLPEYYTFQKWKDDMRPKDKLDIGPCLFFHRKSPVSIVFKGESFKISQLDKAENCGLVVDRRSQQTFSKLSADYDQFSSNKMMVDDVGVSFGDNEDGNMMITDVRPPNNYKLNFSIFSSVNTHLICDEWEENIIWDENNVNERVRFLRIALPEVSLDDSYMIFEREGGKIVEDTEGDEQIQKEEKKKPRKRHLLLPSRSLHVKESTAKSSLEALKQIDKFNLSNDKYYLEDSHYSTKNTTLQHSTYALNHVLMKPTIVLQNRPDVVDSFYRYWHKPHVIFPKNTRFHIVLNSKKEKQKRKQVLSLDTMKKKKDLSAREDRIVIIEYVEQWPPLMMDIGMASRLRNYYRKSPSESNKPTLPFNLGENVILEPEDHSPFLGDIHVGQTLQSFENNLFKAPIFRHEAEKTDFLLIRYKRKKKCVNDVFNIRTIPDLFVVGQQHPISEVHAPSSRSTSTYNKDRLEQYIWDLFYRKTINGEEPILRVREIQEKMFLGESSIRKRLKDKDRAQYRRGGEDPGAWVLNVKLPQEDEIRNKITLDQMCAHECQLANSWRLAQLGISSEIQPTPNFHRVVVSIQEPHRGKISRFVAVELEITCWNTTHCFRRAQETQGLLQITGLGAPTNDGCSYSYLKHPMKVTGLKAEKEKEAKNQVSGTDCDLRKLTLEELNQLLRDYGMTDEEMKPLKRWDKVNKVRDFANKKKALDIDEDTSVESHKFARGSRHNVAAHQEMLDKKVQTIFDNQIQMLSCSEPPFLQSTLENDSSTYDDAILGMDMDIEMTSETFDKHYDEEDRAYFAFVKSLDTKGAREEDEEEEETKKKNSSENQLESKVETIMTNSTHFQVELNPETGLPVNSGIYVRQSKVVDGEIQVTWSSDPVLIATVKKKNKSIIKKEASDISHESGKQQIRDRKVESRTKGSGGGSGIKKVSKYSKKENRVKMGLSDEEESVMSAEDELIGSHEVGIAASRLKMNQSTGVIVNNMVVRFNTSGINTQQRRRNDITNKRIKYSEDGAKLGDESDIDFEASKVRKQRTTRPPPDSPVEQLNYALMKNVLDKLDTPIYDVFSHKVDPKLWPDYSMIVKNPMYFDKMRRNLKDSKYKSIAQFLQDIDLIRCNCHDFNGETERKELCLCADQLFKDASELCKQQKLKAIEASIQQHEIRDNDVFIE